MKKTLMVAAALTALTAAGSASALDTSVPRELEVDGIGMSLGTLTDFIALGRSGNFCKYQAVWESYFNPNQSQTCMLDEQRTAFRPSCIANENDDFTTLLTAGAGVPGVSLNCHGFNLKGEVQPVALILSEGGDGLRGLAYIPSGKLAQLYPIVQGH